jgi:hypothetical protein
MGERQRDTWERGRGIHEREAEGEDENGRRG